MNLAAICFVLGGLVLSSTSSGYSQTLSVVNDQGTVLTGVQVVSVGEHVRTEVRAQPTGTPLTQIQWSATGAHVKDWVTKDAQPVAMAPGDYQGQTIHLVWRKTASCRGFRIWRFKFFLWCNTLSVRATVGSTTLTTTVRFRVVREAKPEKFYSDDFLMENHGNWHAVYAFWAASTRRGDLFLGWHRSQLEAYNSWRQYFGYPLLPYWNPTTPWTAAAVPQQKQHPSASPPPSPGFSARHNLTTLDLTSVGLATVTEGEYDLVTHAETRGTNPEFVAAGYVLRTETVRQLLCEDPSFPCANPAFARNGIATVPTWWQPNAGQSGRDPWFENGCLARAIPDQTAPVTTTCAAQIKSSFDDYTLRELGESIEAGVYALDFQVNYHAFAHVATSPDMASFMTSMRDPIFWAWHAHLDSILTRWQMTKGVEAKGPMRLYTNPSFSDDWTTLEVAFQNRVVPEFVLPVNVSVNGFVATSVTDVSLTGTGYIFRFSGFPVPPDGQVQVVVRREVNNAIRTSNADPRPTPTLIMSTFGQILSPPVNTYWYTKP